MLNMILVALGFCFLCWCYTRLQMYYWYGPEDQPKFKADDAIPNLVKSDNHEMNEDKYESSRRMAAV